jgi:hypothetical protein
MDFMADEPKKSVPRVMSRAAYARHRGCDVREVRRALKSGLIHLERDGSIDPVRADAEWSTGTNPASAKRPGMKPSESTLSEGGKTSSDRISFADARARSESVKAELSELRLRERQGALVDRQKAVAAVFELARAVRGAIETFPARASVQIVAELGADEHATEQALNGALRDLLTTLADVDVERVMAGLSSKSG